MTIISLRLSTVLVISLLTLEDPDELCESEH